MEPYMEMLVFLFILSIITEKTINFIRGYSFQSKVISGIAILYLFIVCIIAAINFRQLLPVLGAIIFLFVLIIIINTGINHNFPRLNYLFQSPFNSINKFISSTDNKTKTKEITFLSIVVGFVFAVMFNADFFKIISKNFTPRDFNPFEYYFTGFELNPDLIFSFKKFIGFLATGFFLSFGSKFFHDLLDLIFQVKNLKQKLNNPNTYSGESIDEISKTLELTHADMVKLVYDREKPSIIATKGVNGINIEQVEWNGKLERGIVVTTENPSLISLSKFIYKTPSQTNYQIPVIVELSTIAIANASISCGDKIQNTNNDFYGSICLPVQNDQNEDFLLTCYHALKHSTHDRYTFDRSNYSEIESTENGFIGHLSKGVLNNRIDGAIVKIDKNSYSEELKASINNITINKVRTIGTNDSYSLNILFRGATTTQETKGIIASHCCSQTIKYSSTFHLNIDELIAIKKIGENKPISKPGDSGALIYTSNGEAICMIIASDDKRSYGIPIQVLLDFFNMNLITQNSKS